MSIWVQRYIVKLYENNMLPLDTPKTYGDGQDKLSEWYPQIDGLMTRFRIHSKAVTTRQCGYNQFTHLHTIEMTRPHTPCPFADRSFPFARTGRAPKWRTGAFLE